MKIRKIIWTMWCILFIICMLGGCKEENDTAEKEAEVKDLEIVLDTKPQDEAGTSGMNEEERPGEQLVKAEPVKKGILIAIDPGHQGESVDMGALEPEAPGSDSMKMKATGGTSGQYTGVPEYQLNLDISFALRDALEAQGYDVLLTRENNETAISNAERAMLANDAGADVLIRIHANGSEDAGANGALVLIGSQSNAYVGHLYEQSYRLGESVLNAYCNKTGMQNRGIVTNDHMTGINWSQIPVIILEMGFMTNEQDDWNMADAEYRKRMVEGIAEGINTYYQPGLQGLDMKIQENIKSLQETGAKVSVYVEDLSNGAKVFFNNSPMKSASLIKLYVAGCAYEHMGELQAGEQYAGETENLICRMIQSSDNDATNTLITRLGSGNTESGMELVNQFCSGHGYVETNIGRQMLDFSSDRDNYTSVQDCGKFLRDIYDGDLSGAEQILSYMKNQERRSKIPAGVPDGIVTANKTGELTDVENDVAIVYAENGTYSLCVMTSDLSDTSGARQVITELSRNVYQYMAENGRGW